MCYEEGVFVHGLNQQVTQQSPKSNEQLVQWVRNQLLTLKGTQEIWFGRSQYIRLSKHNHTLQQLGLGQVSWLLKKPTPIHSANMQSLQTSKTATCTLLLLHAASMISLPQYPEPMPFISILEESSLSGHQRNYNSQI